MTNMAAVTAGKVAAAVAGLLTITVLTRELGPHDFGYYRTALTYVAFASVFADLGIHLVGLREMSKPDADISRVTGNALMLRLVGSVLVLGAASVIGLLLPYDDVVKRGIFIAALIYTALLGSEFLVAVFQRTMRQAGNAIAEAAGGFAALAGVWVVSRLDGGVMAMLCATLFGGTTALAIAWILARRLVPFRPRFDLALWRQYLVAGLPLAGSLVLSMAMLRGDTLLLSLLKPASDVGLYGVPTKMFELTTSLPYLFAGLMMPLFARALSSPNAGSGGSEFARLLGGALDAMLMFGVGAMLALASFAPDVLTFISGSEFAAGAPALVILSFAALLMATSVVLRFALIALDRPRSVFFADAAACGVALLAYFVLIPVFSFVGAAIGTAIAEGSVLVGMAWGIHRAGQALPRCPSALKILLAGAAAALAIQLLFRMGTAWLLSLVIGGVIYVALLAATGAIPRDLATSLFRRPRASDA